MPAMGRDESIGDQELERTPEQLLAGVSEQRLGRAVHQPDHSARVDQQHRMGRSFYDQLVPGRGDWHGAQVTRRVESECALRPLHARLTTAVTHAPDDGRSRPLAVDALLARDAEHRKAILAVEALPVVKAYSKPVTAQKLGCIVSFEEEPSETSRGDAPQLRDLSDLGAPWYWSTASNVLSNGQAVSSNVGDSSNEPSGLGQFKAYSMVFENNVYDIAWVGLHIMNHNCTDSGATDLAADSSYDVKKMARVGSSGASQALCTHLHGACVPGSETRQVLTFRYYSGATTMR